MKTKELAEIPHRKVISSKRFEKHLDFYFEDGVVLRLYCDAGKLPTFYESELIAHSPIL